MIPGSGPGGSGQGSGGQGGGPPGGSSTPSSDPLTEGLVDDDSIVVDAEILPDSDDADADDASTVGDATPRIPDGSGDGFAESVDDDVIAAVGLAERFERERDEYLDHLRRLQAEFENYKRRVETQRVEQRAQAAADLVRELLPVLDACDAAVAHGHAEVEPVRVQLLQTLEKQGLTAVGESGVPFDPHVHEAVMHEEGDGEAVVSDVLRTGYLWNERVVRAAMVKVRG